MKLHLHPLLGIAALMAAAVHHLPPTPLPPGAKTREEVKAELAQAQREGDVIIDFETFQTAREIYPLQYPPRAASAAR